MTMLRTTWPPPLNEWMVGIRPQGRDEGFQQETRLAGIWSPVEFFDYQRISRPADLNQATSVSWKCHAFVPDSEWVIITVDILQHSIFLRYVACKLNNGLRIILISPWPGNYRSTCCICNVCGFSFCLSQHTLAHLVVISIMNYLILISLAFLVFGFAAINKYGMLTWHS
jgi:hypothetical protein